MASRLFTRRLARGSEVFREGELGDCAYVIERGRVAISTRRGGVETVLKVQAPGEMFGEMAIIDNMPRSASAHTLEQTELTVVSREQLLWRVEEAEPVLRLLLEAILGIFRREQNLLAGESTGVAAAHTDAVTNPAETPAAIDRIRLESDLQRALEAGEFQLHYQPQISISSDCVVGAEALIRWQHPQRGMVPPGEFIDAAESSGLIVPLGEWVLQTACAQNKAWQDAGLPPLRMGVNIAARQFHDDGLIPTVEAVLDRSGLHPQWLELEITEGVMIDDVDQVIHKLHRLNDIGVTIAVDDFGTGYSSLAYLKRFPVQRLKIDQSFVRNLTTDPNDAAIVEAVIQLSHGLNLEAIAEGVESEDHVAHLLAKGCDEVQGYHFSRPLAAHSFADWVANHSHVLHAVCETRRSVKALKA